MNNKRFSVVVHLHYPDDPAVGISRQWSTHPTFGGACEAAHAYADAPNRFNRHDLGAIVNSITVHDNQKNGAVVYTLSQQEIEDA